MDRTHFHLEEGPSETIRRAERQPHRTRLEREEVQKLLRDVLEQDIIPRLMNAHRTPLTPPSGQQTAGRVMAAEPVESTHVQSLVELSLHGENHKVQEYVLKLRDQGVPIESLYLDLLTPAARHIGAMWEADSCDFVLVTLALLRIQQVMCDLSPDFVQAGATPSARRVMVAPVPGSHHTFGAAMVADFFRHDGWDVVSSHDLSRADILRVLRKDWFDVVALSISAPGQLISTTSLITDIRKLSSNRGILVMVGGPLALSVPDLATRAGADVVTLDARQAVDVAGRAVPVRGASVAN